MSRRKDYKALPDTHLDRIKADLLPILGTLGTMTLPAQTLYWLVMEVIDSREEIFRLQLCETVDQILAQELDDEEDLLAFSWPDNPYLASDMVSMKNVHKPAFPCADTERVIQAKRPVPSQERNGRRMPRAEK